MSSLPVVCRARAVATFVTVLAACEVAAQVPSLVDPQRSVFAAFPAADGYRVIVRDVNDAARKRIEAALPFRVHFDELGAHSLYVALRGRRPIGMIYAQHEESAYGLAAVEWAVTFDLRVSSFRFQRVRSKHRNALENSEFVRMLKSSARAQLAVMLDKNGQLTKPAKGVDKDAQELAAAVVRSGVKSLAVLETVWGPEIAKLHDLSIGLAAFPLARDFRRIRPTPKEYPSKRSDVVLALRAIGGASRHYGVVVDIRMRSESGPTVVRWIVDADGVVLDAVVDQKAPREFRGACNDVEGKHVSKLAEHRDAIGRAMRSIERLANPNPRPGR